jgi:ribosomal protein S18 acetylase RimI-like enzyme
MTAGPDAGRTFVFDALVDAFDELIPLLPGGACRTGDGYRLHVCPSVPFDLFCGVWLTDPARDASLAEALPDLIAELEARDLPASVFLAADGYEATRRAATALGLAGQGSQTAMVLEAGGLTDPVAGPSLSIGAARDAGALGVALRVAAAGFGAPEAVFAPLYQPSIAAHPGATIYVGEADGTPVTTGVGYVVGDAVGVYSVATPPEHRRRGYAGQVVRRIVSDGFSAGARTAYLLASPDGLGVYERVGFRAVGSYHLLGRAAG